MNLGSRSPTRKRLTTALSLAALVVAASTTVQAAPAPAASTVAPLPARLDQLLEQFARAHPSFPGVALAVRTPTLNWAGAAGVTDRGTAIQSKPAPISLLRRACTKMPTRMAITAQPAFAMKAMPLSWAAICHSLSCPIVAG